MTGLLLLEWFQENARALPWREDYDPYKVLVSEFMLQQTQVDTVLPYFERWMTRYPDLASLAKADEADVKKLWEGLGYYSRAVNLLKAACLMVEEGFSQPPPSVESLIKYPGIGAYTAGAIASIAYNIPVSAVDGNVERVTARLCNIDEPAGSAALKRVVSEKVLQMMPQGKARFFNQALMELGALVCLPKNPNCPACPWVSCCLAREKSVHLQRPLPKQRPATEKIKAWGVLCLYDGDYLLRHRPERGLWAGFWEIPWFARDTENADTDMGVWGRDLDVECSPCKEIGTINFSFTHHRVTAWFVTCELKSSSSLLDKKIKAGEWGFFKHEELLHLTLPAPSRKFLALL